MTGLGLPFVDGWQVTELLKRDSATAHIPVIAVTTHIQNFYRGRVQEVGCDGFLSKPCPPAVLMEEIRRLIA